MMTRYTDKYTNINRESLIGAMLLGTSTFYKVTRCCYAIYGRSAPREPSRILFCLAGLFSCCLQGSPVEGAGHSEVRPFLNG